MTLSEFAVAVQSGCAELGGSITSWGRTSRHNQQVGGSATSRHLAWLAVDIVYDEPHEAAQRREVWEGLGLHFYPEGDHDHVSVPDGGHF